MRHKTPEEKKRESYSKDRRSECGNNAKAARTSVPRNKRLRSRSERRLAEQVLGGVAVASDEDCADEMVNRVKLNLRKAWHKLPDTPLGEVLSRKKKLCASKSRAAADGAY